MRTTVKIYNLFILRHEHDLNFNMLILTKNIVEWFGFTALTSKHFSSFQEGNLSSLLSTNLQALCQVNHIIYIHRIINISIGLIAPVSSYGKILRRRGLIDY